MRDAAPGQVIRADLDFDPVSLENLNPVPPNLARDVRQHLTAIVQGHLEHGVRQGLLHLALHLNGRLLLDGGPQRRGARPGAHLPKVAHQSHRHQERTGGTHGEAGDNKRTHNTSCCNSQQGCPALRSCTIGTSLFRIREDDDGTRSANTSASEAPPARW